MSVESIILQIMKDVPKAVACGIVDMSSGMLLGVKSVDSHPQEVLDLVAAATRDLFEGDSVTEIENTFKKTRGIQTDERYFKEILVMSSNLLHIFARLKRQPTVVITAVCRIDTNIGLALMKMRSVTAAATI